MPLSRLGLGNESVQNDARRSILASDSPIANTFYISSLFFSPTLTTKVFEISFWKLLPWDNLMIPMLSTSKE